MASTATDDLAFYGQGARPGSLRNVQFGRCSTCAAHGCAAGAKACPDAGAGAAAGAATAAAQKPTPQPLGGNQPVPCPQCNAVLFMRAARRGGWFWGCPRWPECRGTRPLAEGQAIRDGLRRACSPP